MSRRSSNRHGYALMLVVVFVVMFTIALGVAWRRVASVLRIEHVSAVRQQCDQGSIQVLAEAMQVLETCLCLNSSSGVARISKTDVSPPNCQTFKTQLSATDPQWYRIDFARENGDTNGTQWSVSVTTVAQTTQNYNANGFPTLPSGPP